MARKELRSNWNIKQLENMNDNFVELYANVKDAKENPLIPNKGIGSDKLKDESIDFKKIKKAGVYPSNIATNSISNVVKWEELEVGIYSPEKNKKLVKSGGTTTWMRNKNFYRVSEGDVVQFNMAFKDAYFIGCNDNDIVLQLSENMDNAGFKEVIVAKGVTRLYTNYYASFKNQSMISINDLIPTTYKETDGKIIVNWITLDEDSVTEEMLKNNSLGKEKFKEKSLDQSVFEDKSIGKEVIKDKAITPELLVQRYSLNAIVKDDLSLGYYTNVIGEKIERRKLAVINWYSPNYFYDVSEGDVIGFNEAYKNTYFVGTSSDGTILQVGENVDTAKETYITVAKGVTRLYVSIYKDYKNSFMLSINTKVPKVYTDYTPKIKLDWLDLQLEEFLSKWVGKKCVWHGDSISWQDGNLYAGTETVAKGYQTWAKEILGFKEIENLAISGKPMANGTTNGDGIVMTIISSKNSSDLVVIAIGTNDFKLNVPLGELQALSNNNVYDDTTFYGAYQKALDKLMREKGVNRIILMTPLQRDNAGYDVNKVNAAGHKLVDYVNAIKKIGELYSVPVWDAYSLSGLNFFNFSDYTLDGLHPNDKGYEFISKSQVNFIDNISPTT